MIGAVAALGVAALKLIKGAGAVKLGLLGATLWSIGLFRPLPFAIAVVYAILVHETGHILAMRRCGLRTSGIWFIPFLGAVAMAKQPFRSHGETFFVAVAGPICGLISIVPLIAAMLLVSRTSADAAAWLAYASAAAFINVFNLLPIGSLDGGRIVKSLAMSLSPRLAFFIVGGGLLLGAGLLAVGGSAVLAILLLLSIFELCRSRSRAPLPPMSRRAVFGGLALYLFLFMSLVMLALVSASASKYLTTTQSSGASYGAIAYGPSSRAWGYSEKWQNRSQAESAALQYCRQHGDDCKLMGSFDRRCGAVVTGESASASWSVADSESQARAEARSQCLQAGNKDCEVQISHCSP